LAQLQNKLPSINRGLYEKTTKAASERADRLIAKAAATQDMTAKSRLLKAAANAKTAAEAMKKRAREISD
jgi:hypothetical protein